jgi:hypothetical protein
MAKLNKPGANPAQESRLNHLPARLLQLNPPGISDLTPPPLHLDACPAINRWSPETALAIPIHAVDTKRPSVAMGVSAEGFDGLGEFVAAESLLALQASRVCAAPHPHPFPPSNASVPIVHHQAGMLRGAIFRLGARHCLHADPCAASSQRVGDVHDFARRDLWPMRSVSLTIVVQCHGSAPVREHVCLCSQLR